LCLKGAVPEIKIDECEYAGQSNSDTSSINNKKMKDAVPSGSEEQIEDPKLSAQEYVGHLQPIEVDTFDVDSDIIRASSGDIEVSFKNTVFVAWWSCRRNSDA
jgi:hypothetical protein